MMEAELSIGGMQFWMVEAASRLGGTITITECIPWRKKGGQALFVVRGTEHGAEEVAEAIRSSPDVVSVDASRRSDGLVVGSVAMKECWIIWAILAGGCFLEKGWSTGDGRANFTILSGREGSLPRIIKTISAKRVQLDILRIAPADERPVVSRKQEALVRLALEKGYFDYPRRIEVRELARQAGLSPSAAHEMLKRGEKNIIRHYFEGGKRA